MNKKLYLRYPDIYLEKDTKRISFCIDSEWVTETIHREDLYFISRAFRIPEEVLKDFFDN